jgi:class 3 adenylate cyclase
MHRGLVRRAVTEHDGREINRAGDACFAAFARAAGAVRAAVAAQRYHARTPWPDRRIAYRRSPPSRTSSEHPRARDRNPSRACIREAAAPR